jgi:hypothetical protein
MLVVRQMPAEPMQAVEHDQGVVRTGASTAEAYGWTELHIGAATWGLDVYVSVDAFVALQEQLNRLDVDSDDPSHRPPHEAAPAAYAMLQKKRTTPRSR